MKRALVGVFFLSLFGGVALLRSAGTQELTQLIRQKTDSLRQSVAANQRALRQYSWIEKTELSVKGDVKSTKIESCRYGPDGTVQKTAVSEPAEKKKKGGIRGKIVQKKTAEMADYMDRANSLISRYVPPAPDKLKAVVDAGRASLSQAGPGAIELKFNDYFKKGDSITFTLDSAAKVIHELKVDSYLDDATDKVALAVEFQTLPDDTNCIARKMMNIAAKEITIRIDDTNYQKLAP